MDLLVSWLAATPSFAEPYALAALGLILSERAGVLQLGAEGFLLVGALAAVIACLALGCGPFLAILIALLATATASVVFAFIVVFLRVNQAIAGLATAFLFQGLTDLIGTIGHWGNRAVTGLDRIPLGPLADIPIVGPVLFDQDIVIYLTLPLFAAMHLLFSRSMLGLRLKAVGDSPETADAVGIKVGLYRFCATIVGAGIIGVGGAYLALADAKVWGTHLANGRGWIAIALVVFARWRPWRALAGALLFGGVEALIPWIAAAGVQVPQYFMLMTPYVATLAVMVWAGHSKRALSGSPLALGQPFVREERR
jgi:general nucleoside transport system permease protein